MSRVRFFALSVWWLNCSVDAFFSLSLFSYFSKRWFAILKNCSVAGRVQSKILCCYCCREIHIHSYTRDIHFFIILKMAKKERWISLSLLCSAHSEWGCIFYDTFIHTVCRIKQWFSLNGKSECWKMSIQTRKKSRERRLKLELSSFHLSFFLG